MQPITLAVRVKRETELRTVNLDLRVVQSTEAASIELHICFFLNLKLDLSQTYCYLRGIDAYDV